LSGLAGLYVILDADAYGTTLLAAAEALFQVGVRIAQYRAKDGIDSVILRDLIGIAARYNALLIINDDLEAARMAGGLHVGQDDLAGRSLAELRNALPDKCIGVSCHTVEQARLANFADYIGVGPLRETASKIVARPPLGLLGIRKIAQSVSIPICAIGGCTLSDVPDLLSAGIAMMAVIGAIAKAPNPPQAAKQFITAFAVSQ
jgi:thiamine-phosphate pyrophosphorylase